MAVYNLLVVESSGKQKRQPSSGLTIDFSSIRLGASFLEIKETAGNLDFGGVKLVNLAAGTAAGQAVRFDEFTLVDGRVTDIENDYGAANGLATLDAGGKVPVSMLPNSVMEYLGTWAASTNTPTLANGTGNAGDVYVASDAGTVNFGAGNIVFAAGDWVIYSGSIWQKSVNSNAVASVNGFTGAVVLDGGDINYTGGANEYVTNNASLDTNILALDARLGNIDAIVGIVNGDTDLGNFSGTTIPDASSIKDALQALETALEGMTSGVASVNGQTGVVVLDGGDLNFSGVTGAYITNGQTLDASLVALDNQLSTVSNIYTLSGVNLGDVDLGTFTVGPMFGFNITANSTIKSALQQLLTEVDAARSVAGSVDQRVGSSGTDMGSFTVGPEFGRNYTAAQSVKQLFQETLNWADADRFDIGNLEQLSGVGGSADLGSFTAGPEFGRNITINTTIKAALQELLNWSDADRFDIGNLESLSGVAGSADLGSFTGVTIPDSSDIKSALQALETALEAISYPVTSVNGLTGAVVLDSGDLLFSGNSGNFINNGENLNTSIEALDSALGAVDSTYLRLDGTNAMSADLNAGGFNVSNMAVATANGEAVEYSQFAPIGGFVDELTNQATTLNPFEIVYNVTGKSAGLVRAMANISDLANAQVGVVYPSAIAPSATGKVYYMGKLDGFTGLTMGLKVYVSRTTAGGYTQSLAGFVAGEQVVRIGRAISATEVVLDIAHEYEF